MDKNGIHSWLWLYPHRYTIAFDVQNAGCEPTGAFIPFGGAGWLHAVGATERCPPTVRVGFLSLRGSDPRLKETTAWERPNHLVLGIATGFSKRPPMKFSKVWPKTMVVKRKIGRGRGGALESCSRNSTMIVNVWLKGRVVLSWSLSGHGAGSSDNIKKQRFRTRR